MNYQQEVLSGKNPVELVVALYDGMVRFLNQAIAAIERGDISARRVAVKRVLDILMHLQSRLRMDVGGSSAQSLAEFYAALFADCLEGSRLASVPRLQGAIANIRNVREAWSLVARDPEVQRMLDQQSPLPAVSRSMASSEQNASSARWSA